MKKIASVVIVLAVLAVILVTGWRLTPSWEVELSKADPLAYCPSVDTPWLMQPVKLSDRLESNQVVVQRSELRTKCDQRAWLNALTAKVTASAETETERLELWAGYLQNAFFHSMTAPVDNRGQAVYSPLWALVNRGVHCGQTARVFVDGMISMGMRARLIQLNGHVAAEGYADGKWHYIDTDVLENAEHVRTQDGTIASVREIEADPTLLSDLISPYVSFIPPFNKPESDWRYESVFVPMMDPSAKLQTPFAYKKTATNKQEKGVYFGWNYYVACTLDDPECYN